MIMIVFSVEAEKPVHPFNYTQTKLSTLIYDNYIEHTIAMKYKSEVVK